jgi:phosphoglycerol transferase MdoB-like AlkP superfamily enzyme
MGSLQYRDNFFALSIGLFLIVNTATRVGLMIFETDSSNEFGVVAGILAIGFLYDVAASVYVAVPFALLALIIPNNPWGSRIHGLASSALIFAFIFLLLFTAVAEFLFWNEFGSRFNFIAVDYLIYTREVTGNIRESFPITLLFLLATGVTLVIVATVWRLLWPAAISKFNPLRRRIIYASAAFALPFTSFWTVGDAPREILSTASARQLASNGYYEFGRAFLSNDLDFRTFYYTLPESEALNELRNELRRLNPGSRFTSQQSIEREVTASAPPRNLNVVLVTMESVGADYVESFGGRKGLTPNLDRLAREGLMFTQMYATGTRTVRGLEAISLSVPPTPGHAVLMRKNNKGFRTLGSVFQDFGYEPVFLYGGYSYFDNMKDFFGGNGYTVVDRTDINRKDISHETIWGVADEDLFEQLLLEIDARVAEHRKIFAHVLTTSNHRPFTYPDNRIDIPSGTGRAGAVKYSDWAIGNFIERASKRPWFKDTLFVFVADHTSRGRGRTDLPMENYRVPFLFYAPGLIAPGVVSTLSSLIDVGPTILGQLNFSYRSQFFGQDILSMNVEHARAFLANYLTVGMIENGLLIELSPKKSVKVFDLKSDNKSHPRSQEFVNKAIAHYQFATQFLRDR